MRDCARTRVFGMACSSSISSSFMGWDAIALRHLAGRLRHRFVGAIQTQCIRSVLSLGCRGLSGQVGRRARVSPHGLDLALRNTPLHKDRFKTPVLEGFYFIGNTHSYLSVAWAAAVAARSGVALRWTPFSVWTLMPEHNNLPFSGKPVELNYRWRDIDRRAERFGVPSSGDMQYPIDPTEIANQFATRASTMSPGVCSWRHGLAREPCHTAVARLVYTRPRVWPSQHLLLTC